MKKQKQKKIGISFQLTPETYNALTAKKSPYLPMTKFIEQILDRLVGIEKIKTEVVTNGKE